MEELAPEDAVEEWSDLSASSLAPGARLGRYELLLPIAQGGMAKVWAARQHGQRGFSKTVAIKTILPNLAGNSDFEKMFLDEARIAAGVHHPNVVDIYELGEEGRVLYLAMEWVNGDSLSRLLRGVQGKTAVAVDPRLAARIVADACAGLHAAHELTDDDGRLLNVVHRDVSPHNILVSLEGTVKMMDFGVAKALGQMHEETIAGQVKGKVAYMAPEQIGGSAFDRRADIFGMGVVLYETLTGVKPFRGESDPQVMQAVLRGVYDPPVLRAKGLPPELSAVIDRALAPEPRMRYATAERMRVALEEWLAKSGSLVTATQVGSLMRQRLGPILEKRREQVKAAMALPGIDSGNVQMAKGLGHTPSKSQPGQSRSGVIAAQPPPPMRGRVPSIPGTTPEPSMRSAMAAPPPPPQLQPVAAPAAPALPVVAPSAPSGLRYVIAAIAGVLFALIVGGIALAIFVSMRARSGEASTAPEPPKPPPAVVAPIAPTAAAVVPTATAPTATASAPAPVASAAPAPPPAAAAASVSPSTVNVSDLPTAKPPPPVWVAPAAPAPPPALPPVMPTAAARKNAPLPSPY